MNTNVKNDWHLSPADLLRADPHTRCAARAHPRPKGLPRSLGLSAICACSMFSAGFASAQQTLIIDVDQSATVNLPAGGGTVQVQPGVSVNPATGGGIVSLPGDVWGITNRGSILSTAGGAVVGLAVGSSLTNFGLVSGNSFGIDGGGYAVNNLFGATITSGFRGVSSSVNQAGAMLTLTNAGTITGFDAGVNATGLGSATRAASIVNSGAIRGNNSGISITQGGNATSSVTNQAGGSIIGTGPNSIGLLSRSGRTTVVNEAGATIQGNIVGVYREEPVCVSIQRTTYGNAPTASCSRTCAKCGSFGT